jgi:hypothetical protein
MVDNIRTMGFEVREGEIRPDSHKIDMLRKTNVPKTKADLKAYLGLLQFYRGMLPHLAHAAHQLYAATSDNFSFQWTSTLQQAFEATKDMLQKDILLTNFKGPDNIKVYDYCKQVCGLHCYYSRWENSGLCFHGVEPFPEKVGYY